MNDNLKAILVLFFFPILLSIYMGYWTMTLILTAMNPKG